MKILLTGFTTFDTHTLNSSELIVRMLTMRQYTDFTLVTQVLPVVYQAAGERIVALVDEHQPDAVVCLGLAGGRRVISLERVALNVDDASIADNVGDWARGRLIADDGPAAYWSALPLDTLQHTLTEAGIPVEISNHAGAYVCNHVFYTVRHHLTQQGSRTPCGFIHVPALAADEATGMTLSTMTHAIELCLYTLARQV